MTEYKKQEIPFPLKILLLPLLVGTLIALLNIKWMQLFQLLNAPQADSLVYMTESFNDYWSMRNGDISGLFKKYFEK